jgi:putative holliday junction resolvase
LSRILCIDYGLKRSGIAVTDPMQIIATGLTTVDTKNLMVFLVEYLEKEDVESIVIGYPTNLDGSNTDLTVHVETFISKLSKQFPQLTVYKEDERFTSKMAVKAMVEGGVKKMKRRDKKLIDKVSAVLILQSYLERKEK